MPPLAMNTEAIITEEAHEQESLLHDQEHYSLLQDEHGLQAMVENPIRKNIQELLKKLCSKWFNSRVGGSKSTLWIHELCRRVKGLIVFHSKICSCHRELIHSLNDIAIDSTKKFAKYFDYMENNLSFSPASMRHYTSSFRGFFQFYLHREKCTVSQEDKDNCHRTLALFAAAFDKATLTATKKAATKTVQELIADGCWPLDGINTIRQKLLELVQVEEDRTNGGFISTPEIISRRIGNLIIALYTFAVQPRIGYIASLTNRNILDAIHNGMYCVVVHRKWRSHN